MRLNWKGNWLEKRNSFVAGPVLWPEGAKLYITGLSVREIAIAALTYRGHPKEVYVYDELPF
jgi:hypothetical protein